MVRIACDEEAIVTFKVLAKDGKAVVYRLDGIVFVVDALWS